MAKTKDKFRAGLIQMRSSRNIQENLAKVEAFIREAAGKGADFIQTPENTLLMEANSKQLLEKITPEEATEGLSVFSRLAHELGVWLHIGSIAIKLDDKHAANRAFLFAPDGRLAAHYDKIHMFDVNLPSGETYREVGDLRAGREGASCGIAMGRARHYDMLRHALPEQYKALAQAGAKFLSAPSAFTKVTGEAHWHVLLRARAIENGCFVFAAAQGGDHESGRGTYGHSIIISPWGEVLAEAEKEPGVILADIDVTEVDRVRARIPALDHARPFDVTVVPLADEAKLAAE